jgi:hypothetical protein
MVSGHVRKVAISIALVAQLADLALALQLQGGEGVRKSFVLLLLATSCGGSRSPGLGAEVFPLPQFSFSPAALGGSAEDDVWLTGDHRSSITNLHWDGHAWSPINDPSLTAKTIASGAPHDVWLGGLTVQSPAPALRHWDGTQLQPVDVGDQVYSLFATTRPDDVWACGLKKLLHFDGTAWGETKSPIPLSFSLADGIDIFTAGASTGPNDVWALHVGPGAPLYHYDGTDWTTPDAPENLSPGELWTPSPDELWVAITGPRGQPTQLARRVRGVWSRLDVGGDVVSGFAGRSATDAFVIVNRPFDAGSDGASLLHFDGTSLQRIDSTSLRYDALWVGPSSVWVLASNAQDESFAIHYPL